MTERAPSPIPSLDILRFKLNTKFDTANQIVEHPEVRTGWWSAFWPLKAGARWKREEKLGEGGYGEVYLQQEQQTGELRAVKEVKLDSAKYKKLGDRHKVIERELRTMLALRNNNLFVKCQGWYEDMNSIYIAMEYMKDGDLSQYIRTESKTITEEKARQIVEQVIDGLVVLHQRKICHRDLKPKPYIDPIPTNGLLLLESSYELRIWRSYQGKTSMLELNLNRKSNILIASLDPLRIKLADFGSSKNMANMSQPSNRGGTLGYMAPELLGYQKPNKSFDWMAVDMWALGCVVFEILTGQTPFAAASKVTSTTESISGLDPEIEYTLEANTKLFHAYCTGDAEFPEKTLKLRIRVSEWGVEFCKRCLTPKQWLRITSSEARMHSWITKRGELDTLIFKYEMGDCSVMGEALLLAANSGGTKSISHLLDRFGVDLNAKEARVHGRTALQAVAGNGHIETVSYLLDRGADINIEAAEFGGRTALQAAAGRGHLNVVSLLLSRGADIDAGAAEFDGRTALQAAAGSGHIGVVRLLLEKGAPINARAGYVRGRTALQAAAGGGHTEVVELLLREGADVSAKAGDEGGRTALQAAAGGGHTEVVRCLLGGGADVNAEPGGSGGLTALQAAAGGGYIDTVKVLLIKGATLNARAGEIGGRTALQAAAGNGQTQMVEILVSIGAHINAEGAQSNGRTALQAAAEGRHSEIVLLLLGHGAKVNARAVDYHGRTALQAAAGSGYLDIVSLLLTEGADVNACAAHSSGRTALQAAAENGHMDTVLLLLDRGADINAEAGDIEGRTALQAAAGGGHLDVVLLLLEKGANINASAGWGNGMTAFQAAVNGGHGAIVRHLFDKGAHLKPKDEASSGRITLGVLEVSRMLRRPEYDDII
ncbi:ankyrin repeat-containing domain protein [Morchella snyderi]|nr:ankyrin repeat-containing domain protein [Morchella snyderi]